MKARDSVVSPTLPRGAFERSWNEQRFTRVRIRTRGPFPQYTLSGGSGVELQVFVGWLREHLGALPLNVVISAVDVADDADPSRRFLEALAIFLDARMDSVWVLAPSGAANLMPRPQTAFLNSTNALDTRIRDNLVADVLFLPALEKSEADELMRFRGRTSLLLLPTAGEHTAALTLLASEFGITALEWDASQSLIRSTLALGSAVEDADGCSQLSSSELEAIGQRLVALAGQLNDRRERRGTFRQALVHLMRDYESQERWSETLIELAENFDWPPWAVEMLPKLYVRLSSEEADSIAAFVWRPIFDWMPDYERYVVADGNLCKGHILRVEVPPELDLLLSSLQAEIEENLRGNPYHGEEVFFGRIADAVDAVASAHGESSPDVARVLERLSQQLVLRASRSSR